MRLLRTTSFSVLLSVQVASLSNFLCLFCKAQERETQKEVCANFAGVKPPPYNLVRQWHADVHPMPILFVSVKQRHMTRDSMIALACRIGKDHSSERALDLYIFDDQHAAKVYSPAHEGNTAEVEKALRAMYEFSREKGQQWIDLRPAPNSKWIHVDLGKAPEASE